MGIDIGFYNESTKEIDDFERLCNVEGFFAIAEMLTTLMDLLDEMKVPYNMGHPTIEEHYQAFQDYLLQDHETGEERFAQYCDFICQSLDVVTRKFKLQAEFGQPLAIRPRPEEFNRETRAFLGRALLNRQPINPGEARQLLLAMTWVVSLFGVFVTHYKQSQPELSGHLHGLVQQFFVLGRFLEAGIKEDRPVAISF